MPSFCVVSNCEYKYTHVENVSFHKFPYNSPDIFAKWIKFADRGPKWKPSRWSAICSRHFLPSDFRNLITRKCLKKDAVPSITIKQFTGNFLDLQSNDDPKKVDSKFIDNNFQMTLEEQQDVNCRLCGLCCKSIETFTTNFEVFGMIKKCFPTLNIQQDDDLPKNICTTCLDRLHLFSEFVDEVLRTQKDLESKFNNEQNQLQIMNIEKSLKIKQEPVIKVKQEVNEGVHSTTSDDLENEANDEQDDCDQKSQLHYHLPIVNSEEIINNCDIMEIISLDDAFIDIPDDDFGEETPTPTQEPIKIQTFKNIDDHNYAKSAAESTEISNEPCYKTETNEDHDLDVQISSEPNIVVIDESIVKSGPTIPCFQCDICALVFLHESTLNEHRSLYHAPAIRICVPCNLHFDSFYKFLKHKNKFHKFGKKQLAKKKTNLNCPMCEKTFTSKLALNNHRKYICDHQYEQEYECKHCGKKLSRWSLLRHHEKICRQETDLTMVGEKQDQEQPSSTTPSFTSFTVNSLPSGSQLKVKPNKNGQFECPICGRTYTRRPNLFKHQVTHRPSSLWNHKCGDCNKLFDHIYDLRRHLKTKACSGNNKVDGADDNDQKPPQTPQQLFFICTICGKQLKTLQRLKQHSISHTGKKPYVCESCGKSFVNVYNLYQHHITHSDVRRYKCDLCEKVFKRRGGLNQHKRAYHFKIKPHECPTCKHRYALKGDMIRCKHSLLRQ